MSSIETSPRFTIKHHLLRYAHPSSLQRTKDYPISKIKKDKEKQNLYTIYYKTKDSQEYEFSFYFDPSGQGTIRLKNQRKYVWKKVKG